MNIIILYSNYLKKLAAPVLKEKRSDKEVLRSWDNFCPNKWCLNKW